MNQISFLAPARRTLTRLGPLACALALAVGCSGGTASVSGEVTYEGQPVDKGMITFVPADGKGPSAGVPIARGKFRVDKLSPGPKVVRIEAVKEVPFARSSDEMAKRLSAARARGDHTGIIDRADVVPENAVGNNVQMDIKAGKQELNFHLKQPPASSKSR